MVLMTICCILVVGASILFKAHQHEHYLLQHSYRIKTMLNMVENDLLDPDIERQDYLYVFNQGQVQAKYIPPTQYVLTGTLDNGFENKRYLYLQPQESQDPIEKTAHPE